MGAIICTNQCETNESSSFLPLHNFLLFFFFFSFPYGQFNLYYVSETNGLTFDSIFALDFRFQSFNVSISFYFGLIGMSYTYCVRSGFVPYSLYHYADFGSTRCHELRTIHQNDLVIMYGDCGGCCYFSMFLLSVSTADHKLVLQALLFIDIYIMNFSLGCQLFCLKLH